MSIYLYIHTYMIVWPFKTRKRREERFLNERISLAVDMRT